MTERKATKFVELLAASILGLAASKLYDIIYSTPIVSAADSWMRASFYVPFVIGVAAFLFFCAYSKEIVQDIYSGRRKYQESTQPDPSY